MKIIGKTNYGFILEASNDEAANLIGYHSQYQNKRTLEVGQEINIADMYRQLYDLSNAQDELTKCSEALKRAATLVKNNPLPISCIKVGPVEK